MVKIKIHRLIVTLISFVLIAIIFLVVPLNSLMISAICCRKDGFDKSEYTLTGNMAEDVATIAKSQKGRTGAQLGYTEAWCDEYVADCLENAGADSSIVGHGGTVADFETVMREKGAMPVSSPQTGDLVFFNTSGAGISHVGMYVGNNNFIEAADSGVKLTSLSSPYATRTYVGAKRIILD